MPLLSATGSRPISVGKTPYERRFGKPVKGPTIPFGSLVEYHPAFPKDQARLHHFGKKVLLGIFLGYVLYAWRIWKGDMLVADLKALEKMDASDIHAKKRNAKEVMMPKSGANSNSSRRWDTVTRVDESTSLEEIKTWEHPPRYGTNQFEEKVVMIFWRHRFIIWWEDALWKTFWATIEGTYYSIWFIVWVSPYNCQRSVKNPSIWKESFTWIVPRIRSVRGESLEGWRTGCIPWGVGDDRIKTLGGDQDLRTST